MLSSLFFSLVLANASTCSCVKPWPNGLARRGKLKTWVYLRLLFARSVFTLVEIKVFTLWPPKPSQPKTSIRSFILIARESPQTCNGAFVQLACTSEETCESVLPPNGSLYASST